MPSPPRIRDKIIQLILPIALTTNPESVRISVPEINLFAIITSSLFIKNFAFQTTYFIIFAPE